MASYLYVAVDKNGKEKKGTVEANSENAAMTMIKADGFIPISVKEGNALNKELKFNIGKKVTPRDLSLFCRQMVSILGAGVTVISALQMLSDQTENKTLCQAIKEVQ